jgi:hypothetical protein
MSLRKKFLRCINEHNQGFINKNGVGTMIHALCMMKISYTKGLRQIAHILV